MENDSVFTIISYYQGVYRGIVEYYRMAHNVYQLNKLKWIMETSCAPCRCVWNACIMQGRLRAE
jgi:hypothetical protein